jgi:hypothetical protein
MQAIANKVSSMRDSMDSHLPLKRRILFELMEELKSLSPLGINWIMPSVNHPPSDERYMTRLGNPRYPLVTESATLAA